MKKAFLLLLLTATSLAAHAGRSADMELRLLSPQTNTSTPTGSTVNVVLQIRNTGGDDLQVSDTIRINLTVDGFAVPFYNPTNGSNTPYLSLKGFYLAPGDSAVIFSQSFGINDSGNHTFCFESSLSAAASTAAINDFNTANDKSCASIFFGTVGINTVDRKEASFEIFPLPASSTLNWKSSDNFQPSSISLYNLTGACVQHTEVIAGNTALDIAHLPSALYILRATDKNGTLINRRFLKE